MIKGMEIILGAILILSLLSFIQVNWGTLFFLIFITQGISLFTMVIGESWEIVKLKNRKEQVNK